MLPELSPLAFVAGLAAGLRSTGHHCSPSSSSPGKRYRCPAAGPTSQSSLLEPDQAHGPGRADPEQGGPSQRLRAPQPGEARAGRPQEAAGRLPADGRGRRPSSASSWVSSWAARAWPSLMLVLTPVGLIVFLNLLVSRRRKKFDEQVPDTLQMFAGGLRAGHSLLRSVDAAAQENEAPMAEELNRVVNETRIGRDLGESLTMSLAGPDNEDFGCDRPGHRNPPGSRRRPRPGAGPCGRDHPGPQPDPRPGQGLSAEGRMSAIVLMALPDRDVHRADPLQPAVSRRSS